MKIQLPQGYLSYSQIDLWQKNKERYKQIYFAKRDDLRIKNSGLDYGKVVATALENEKDTGDLLTDTAMGLLTKYDTRDQEIRTTLKTVDGDIDLLGRPDTLDSKSFAFREFKTGKTKWTEKKAQNSLQIKFYAMLVYLHHKKLLHEAHLDWIETTQTDEGIKPTGRVESFRVPLTLNDILQTMALTSKIAKEIEVEWANYKPESEKPW